MPKPALLLLPGLLNDARLWQAQTADLSEGAQVQVADLTGADSIAGLAAAALAQAPAERFALAGLSMGGYVALEILRQAPERVRGLALLDTSARPDTAESTANRRQLIDRSQTDFTGVVDTLLPKLLHPDHLNDTALTRVVHAMARDVGASAFVRQQTAIMGRIDSRPHLGDITCPALVLCGREDAITPIEVHEEMAAAIPDALLMVIASCGHLSALEQSDEVTAALKRWLARLKAD
jgi:pimeloyl-ACP methyl ester carboxylesterase